MKWKIEKILRGIYQLLVSRENIVKVGFVNLRPITLEFISLFLYGSSNGADRCFEFLDGEGNKGMVYLAFTPSRFRFDVYKEGSDAHIYWITKKEGRIDEVEETLDSVAN
jgi:hypothetical protein